MSFYGFQPHKNGEDGDAPPPRRPQNDDASDSGYGGSISVDSDGSEAHAREEFLSENRSSTPNRATYQRGSSSLNHHRSPSSRLLTLFLFFFFLSDSNYECF